MISRNAKTYLVCLGLFFALEVLSFFGWRFHGFGSVVYVIVCLATVALALVRFDLAFLLLLADLFVGSQGGALLVFNYHGLDISLRIGLFLAVGGVWAGKMLAKLISRDAFTRAEGLSWYDQLRREGLWKPYTAVTGTIFMGTLGGLLRRNDTANIFFDANGYFYFFLFPVFLTGLALKSVREKILPLLAAAMTAATAKALFVLFIFSHRQYDIAKPVYLWVRDTRVGEITRMVGDFYRVFFQSHLFLLLVAVGLALAIAYSVKHGRQWRLLAGLVVVMTALLLGLSRSFWFGGFVAVIGLVAMLISRRAPAGAWKRLIAAGLASTVGAALVIMLVYSFPFPPKGESFSLASLLGDRAFSFGDDAAKSRWELLPKLMAKGAEHPFLGSGLGTTVTYATSDPRLLAANKTAEYTTFAFEWGYHDLWVKFGLVGLTMFSWFLFTLGKRYFLLLRQAWRKGSTELKNDQVLVAGLFLGYIALLATHVFSPYLNHPLGIGFMLILGSLLVTGQLSEEPIV